MAEKRQASGWGGKRIPGPGKRLGRPRRHEPKARPLWVGQVSEGERRFIMKLLTPQERKNILMNAAYDKAQQERLLPAERRLYLVTTGSNDFTIEEALQYDRLKVVVAADASEAIEQYVRELLIRQPDFLQYVYDEFYEFSFRDDLFFEVGGGPEERILPSEEGREFGARLFDAAEAEEAALGAMGWEDDAPEDDADVDEEIDAMLEDLRQNEFERAVEEFFLEVPDYADLYLDYCRNCNQDLPWEENMKQWPFPEDMLAYIALHSMFYDEPLVIPIDSLTL